MEKFEVGTIQKILNYNVIHTVLYLHSSFD
jgi:hypothetical protein